MITIRRRTYRQRPGRLEPDWVRYQVVEQPEVARFAPVSLTVVERGQFRPQVAAVYGTNCSPRDRMRHEHRWADRKMRIARWQILDPRWR